MPVMPLAPTSPAVRIDPVLPHSSWDADRILAAWGAPPEWDLGALRSAAIHHAGAGDRLFELPPLGEMLAFARRVRVRRQAHPALVLLGTLALFSQHPLPEVRALVLPALHREDPVAAEPAAADEWRDLDELALLVAGARPSRFPHSIAARRSTTRPWTPPVRCGRC